MPCLRLSRRSIDEAARGRLLPDGSGGPLTACVSRNARTSSAAASPQAAFVAGAPNLGSIDVNVTAATTLLMRFTRNVAVLAALAGGCSWAAEGAMAQEARPEAGPARTPSSAPAADATPRGAVAVRRDPRRMPVWRGRGVSRFAAQASHRAGWVQAHGDNGRVSGLTTVDVPGAVRAGIYANGRTDEREGLDSSFTGTEPRSRDDQGAHVGRTFVQAGGGVSVPPARLGPAVDGTLSVLVHLDAQADRTVIAGGVSPVRAAVRDYATRQGARIQYEYDILPNVINVRGLPPAALATLAQLPHVARVEEDYVVHTMHNDSVPLIRGRQSQLQDAGFDGVDGAGIRICVVDTGIDANSLMYSTRIDAAAGWDFVNDDADPEDDQGHGSHVAGTALGGFVNADFACAATGPESMQGVAPAATLLGVKVLNATGFGTVSDVIAGIDHCASSALPGGRADVINLSLGGGQFPGTCDSDPGAMAVNNAVAAGVVVVAAAGNDGLTNAVGSPACASGAIAVAATYDDSYPNCDFPEVTSLSWGICLDSNPVVDQRTCFSNRSTKIDVAAPGCIIFSNDATAAAGDGLIGFCGTSQAAPHVAGLAALLLDADPSLTPTEVRTHIRGGAVDLGPLGFDSGYGYGRIDVIDSLAWTPCSADAECHDALFCNGVEACETATGLCQAGINPCEAPLLCRESDDLCVNCLSDSDCDDGLYCNGAETCVTAAGVCEAGEDPCTDPPMCRESDDTCVECLYPPDPQSSGSTVGWGQYVLAGNLSRGFVNVAAGSFHNLALRDDGSVVAWGNAGVGRTDVPTPNADFIAVSSGGAHNLGLKADGSVVAWGSNSDGQTDVPAPNADFVAVAAGVRHSLGLKANGAIAGWGWNDYGTTDVPAPNADFVGMAAGPYHSVGLKANGSIVEWGCAKFECDDEQCVCAETPSGPPLPNTNFVAVDAGDFHNVGLRADGTIVAWGCSNRPEYDFGQCNVPAPNTGFVALAAGAYHSLGVKADGSIVAWGRNDYRQTSVPDPNSDFVVISAGAFHSVALTADGSVVAWGDSYDGQTNAASPNTGFVAIATGSSVSLGLRDDGSVVAWGWDINGALDVPVPNTDFIALHTGGRHSLGLKSNGSIVGWGPNESGQIDVPAPNAGFTEIAAGLDHSLGLRADGSIVAWGCSPFTDFGQCEMPVPNTGFVAIDTKMQHNLALKADGSILAWGLDNDGQLDVPAPNADFVAIAAGVAHSLGVKADGSVVAWGCEAEDRDYGQCDVPAQGNNGFIAVAAGTFHSLALKNDGSIVGWGWNNRGQTEAPFPNGGFTAIAAGFDHSLAIRGDADSDAVLDEYDNCQTVFNPDQIDCQENCIGDACEGSPDCNQNTIPDECEAYTDCNQNEIPDECEENIDCNANGTLDGCDIMSGTSADTDGNGIPDECDVAPAFAAEGCRALVVTPVADPRSVALRLRAAESPCFEGYLSPDGTLGDAPVFAPAEDWGTLVVVHEQIVPEVQYAVVAQFDDGKASSLVWATTSVWGDVVGVAPTDPPDGNVSFRDIGAVVACYKHLTTAPPLYRCDMHPATPDGNVNFLDIGAAVQGYKTIPYPFPGPCP